MCLVQLAKKKKEWYKKKSKKNLTLEYKNKQKLAAGIMEKD